MNATMRRWTGAMALWVCMAGVFPPLAARAAAATSADSAPTLDAATRKAALEAIRDNLGQHYFDPQRLPRILSRLDEADAQGRYATPDPAQFAERVTEDLQAVTRDTHLFLSFHPEWYRLTTQPADPARDQADRAYEAKVARTTNFGIVESRVLAGNVRYLRLDGFGWIEGEGLQAYEDAMRFLKGGRAIILDLRGNRGGDTVPAYYLLSHFFEPDQLMYTWHAAGKPDVQLRANPTLANGRLTGRPLYVLVDGRSRSAAEAIAYAIRQFKLGDVVGERTEGAANPSDDFAVAPYYRLSIPVMSSEDPVAHGDWEGVGVAPTIPAAASDAFDVAYAGAVERLLRTTDDPEERAFLTWAQDGLAGGASRAAPTPAELAAWAGDYGALRIRMRGASLWLLREGRPARELEPTHAPGLFAAKDDPMLRVRFDKRGLALLYVGGRHDDYARTARGASPR